MAGDIKAKFGTSNQAITLTLANLANSATVGRASTYIDNVGNLFLDVLITLFVETGTVTGNKQIAVYGYGSSDSGLSYTEGVTGADVSFTRQDPTNLKLLGAIWTPSSATIYKATFTIADKFGGVLPERWGLFVANDSGAALTASVANNKAFYQGVSLQYT